MFHPDDIHNDFASLVKTLHKQPDNMAVKQQLLTRMLQMREAAKNNPAIQYQLAQLDPPGSPQFRQKMQQAADAGNTNAMLSLCQVLLRSGSANDLQTSVRYMQSLLQSGDTYVIGQAQELLKANPQLVQALKQANGAETMSFLHRFFTEKDSSMTMQPEYPKIIPSA